MSEHSATVAWRRTSASFDYERITAITPGRSMPAFRSARPPRLPFTATSTVSILKKHTWQPSPVVTC